MPAGAWGAAAGGLLAAMAERRGVETYRVGGLTMLSPPDFAAGAWCCWLFGEPQDRGTLAARFGAGAPGEPTMPGNLTARGDLTAAFGRALLALGEQACELLQGRFVVVALDRERDRCLVIRDQLGAQPLVHTQIGDGVLFAEHECELLDLLPQIPSPDRLALQQWVQGGLTPPRHTLFEGLRRLPAGHRLTLDGGRVSVERWWELRYQEPEPGDPAALGERLREAAFAAVGRAAANARHPALKLSGGLDSACVAAGLAANGLADGRAIAIAGTFAEHPVTDERELIQATARHTQLELERIAFDSASSILAPALAHILRWRLPPATPNLFLWQPAMARARELGVDALLDGEGGDELFGVAPYLIADRLRAGRLPAAWSLTSELPGVGHNPTGRLRLSLLRRFGLSPLVPDAVRHRRETRAETRAAAAGSSSAILPQADAQALRELTQSSRTQRREGPLWWRFLAESLIDERDILDVGGHFRREAADGGLDRRHPFLHDLRLTEAALRIPPLAQFDPIRDRPLLRDALSGLIPEAVRTRHTKSHFTPILLAGIQADEAGLIEPLRQPAAPIRAYVRGEALDSRIGVAPSERSLLGAMPLWRLAIADLWLISLAGEGS
jgi:asparagine synthase (glutamine-hydrolysing)